MRTVVVGASTGLGRYLAIDRGKRGDQVALLARRKEHLQSAAEEAGDAHPFVCDVTDEASCVSAIAQAARTLGGIDALVYSAGIGPLQPVEQLTAETWRRTIDTNVVGAALITAAALPHLKESQGVAAYLSSISASMGRPWPGFGAYVVSKAGLDKLIEVFRVEHPSVRFTRVVVGDCAGGEGDAMSHLPVTSGWDAEVVGPFMEVWKQRGYYTGFLMDVQDLADGIDFVLHTRASVPSIGLVPRGED